MTSPLMPILAIAAFFIAIRIIQALWNSTLPDIFQIRKITYWEACRIAILCWLLFGGGSLVHYSRTESDGYSSTTYGIGGSK